MEQINNQGPKADIKLSSLFAKGVLWVGSSSIITSAVRLLVVAVLARLLLPKDFGLFGLTLLIVDFGNELGDLGTGPAIIQSQKINQRLLSTAFWLVILGSIILFISAIAIAPLLAWFFHEQSLMLLIIVSSFSFIIRSAGFVHRALLQKNLLFNKIAIVEISATLLFGLCSITLASLGLGVWSLVFGLLAHRLSDVILLWLLSDFRPTFEFDLTDSRHVFHFAWNVTGERVSYFLSSRMDYIIIGRMLGASLLGYYTLASEITSLPEKRISGIISNVAFPTFSVLQNQNERLRNAFMKVNKTLSLVAFPLLTGLIVFAPEFVRVFYGEDWGPVIVPMQILCIVGTIKSIMRNNGTIFFIKNRPDLSFKWGITQMVTIPIPLLIGTLYGLSGVATALTITFLIYFIYIQNIVNSLIGLKFQTYLKIFFSGTIASMYMVGVAVICKISLFFLSNDLLILITGCIISGISYLFFVKLLDQSSWYELKYLAKKILPHASR